MISIDEDALAKIAGRDKRWFEGPNTNVNQSSRDRRELIGMVRDLRYFLREILETTRGYKADELDGMSINAMIQLVRADVATIKRRFTWDNKEG